MSGLQVAVTVVSGLLGAGGLGAALVQHLKNKADLKVAGSADWATFATELRQALSDERSEAARDAEARDTRIAALQEALNVRDMAMRARDLHIDALKAQIWARREPPPVDPPTPY